MDNDDTDERAYNINESFVEDRDSFIDESRAASHEVDSRYQSIS
jgi:hypothetical protein